MSIPHIKEKTESMVIHYPEAEEFTNEQLKIFWLPDEVKVEKDVHDILTGFTESEKHGVITTLRLFTLYELHAGQNFWTGKFMKIFRRPELAAMGATFGMFELAIHRPFYNKINELLHLNTDEFYLDYVNDPTLKSRMEFIEDVISNKHELLALAGFSMVEGAVLYSSFAFLKHFQSNGKNKLNNIVRGINFSIRDEGLHSLAGSWSFKTLKRQMKLNAEKEASVKESVIELAHVIYEHESRIVDMIFEKGNMTGISKESLKIFVKSRLNECLIQLGYDPVFVIDENPIADYFYDGLKMYSFNDFFAGIGHSYSRSWGEEDFVWKLEGKV